MDFAQSPHVPSTGTPPRWRDLGWLVPYALRGLWELVRARVIFIRLAAKAIPERNRRAKAGARGPGPYCEITLARIAYVLPRLSDRLPWRSDCLIQAIAGQNWLSALGAASEIQIGVEKPRDGQFGAHAWLLCEGGVVTGGEIEQYRVILSESPQDRR
jgi:hypothetical protein